MGLPWARPRRRTRCPADQPGRVARTSPGRAREADSMRSYCSSGLRECSRLRVSIMLTVERAGAGVRIDPLTPNRIGSVTLRK